MLTVTDVALWDFDGYLSDAPYEEKVEDPKRKFGHAFVLQRFVQRTRERTA
jgi:hypothetical protein